MERSSGWTCLLLEAQNSSHGLDILVEKVVNIFKGTILLQVHKAYKAEFSFAFSLSMWPEKDSYMPRNLTYFSKHVWPTQVIVLLPISKSLTWE